MNIPFSQKSNHVKNSHLIYNANHLNGFYMVRFLTERYFWLDISCFYYLPSHVVAVCCRNPSIFFTESNPHLIWRFFHILVLAWKNLKYMMVCVANNSLKKGKFRNRSSILDWAFCKNSKRLKAWKVLATLQEFLS